VIDPNRPCPACKGTGKQFGLHLAADFAARPDFRALQRFGAILLKFGPLAMFRRGVFAGFSGSHIFQA
jgi:hypothetical protein